MRNLKRLATSLVALVFVIAFSSCEKQPAADMQGEVSFNINNVTENLKKGLVTNPYDTDTLPTCTDATASYVMIGLNGDNPVRLEILSGMGNVTQVMKYTINPDFPEQIINSFMVYDDQNNMIWATPTNGSKYQLLWGLKGVDKPFTPIAFKKSVIDIDVLCWEEYSYTEFGFNWFEFHEVTVKTLCFFGDICTKFYDDFYTYRGSPYFGSGTTEFDLPAIMSVYIKDADGKVVNDTDNDIHNNWKYEDGTLWQGGGSPLCIEYPYFADDDQALTFEIWLMYPDATQHLVYTSDPFMASADQETITGTDGVFDFVVGNCSYDGNTTNVELPPYLFLPETVNATATWVVSNPGFLNAFHVDMNYFDGVSASPYGNNTLFPAELVAPSRVDGWCGDIFNYIPSGGTYDFNIYSSLGDETAGTIYEDYPSGGLNWLANQEDAIIAAGAEGEDVQAIVWLLVHLGDLESGDLGYAVLKNKIAGYLGGLNIEDAIPDGSGDTYVERTNWILANHGDYIPETGAWSIVFFDPIEGSGPDVHTDFVQLILVRVDP